MTKFFQNVLATIMAAAIISNVAVLWQLNERITRIEAQLSVKIQQLTQAHE
jgi:hypothetical protein